MKYNITVIILKYFILVQSSPLPKKAANVYLLALPCLSICPDAANRKSVTDFHEI
jgi:hypothetical protein